MLELTIPEFFPPSRGLTRRILKQMNEKRATFLRTQASQATSENVEDQAEESGELLQAILTTLEEQPESTEAGAEEDQRWLREIIYHFLGRLKVRPPSEHSKQYDVAECFVKGMGNRLGLTRSEETFVLEELAREFSEWLNGLEKRTFVAGWGKIVGDEYDSNTMRLEDLAQMQAAQAATNSEVVQA